MSTKIGVAPVCKIDSAVLTKVCAVVITSSPLPILHANNAHSNAVDPLLVAAQASAPVYSAIVFSN